MRIYVAKTLENMKKFGPVYDLSAESPDRVSSHTFGEDINEWFLKHFIDRINAECDTLLDYGDYDYLDSKKCKNLLCLLNDEEIQSLPGGIQDAFEILKECASEAIANNTGIAIEM